MTNPTIDLHGLAALRHRLALLGSWQRASLTPGWLWSRLLLPGFPRILPLVGTLETGRGLVEGNGFRLDGNGTGWLGCR